MIKEKQTKIDKRKKFVYLKDGETPLVGDIVIFKDDNTDKYFIGLSSNQ